MKSDRQADQAWVEETRARNLEAARPAPCMFCLRGRDLGTVDKPYRCPRCRPADSAPKRRRWRDGVEVDQ